MMRWHPDASAELAVAFSHFNQVYVYDLEAWSTEPTRVYEVGHRAKGSAGGNVSLTFARHAPQRGGGCFMVAGSTYGMLRCWDMRRTDRLYWEVKLRSSQGTPHRPGHMSEFSCTWVACCSRVKNEDTADERPWVVGVQRSVPWRRVGSTWWRHAATT